MKEPTEITITMNDRSFELSFPVRDEEMLEIILAALDEYVKNGSPLKVKQTYMSSLSDSVRIITRLLSKSSQVLEWRDEVRQLIRVLQKQAKD